MIEWINDNSGFMITIISFKAAFWTMVTAIAIIVSARIALRTFRDSLQGLKYDITYQLFKEFVSYPYENSFLYQDLIKKEYKNLDDFKEIHQNIEQVKIEATGLLLFFAKIGAQLRKKVISLKELELYFYNYLFHKQRMLILLKNIKLLKIDMPKELLNDFDYLMKTIGHDMNIPEFNVVTGKTFVTFKDYGKGFDNFKPRKLK